MALSRISLAASAGDCGIRDHPLHFAGFDFVLRDAAGLAGMSFDHRRSAALQLPGATRRHQDVTIIAIEAVHQLHKRSPASSGATRAYIRNESKIGFNRSRILRRRQPSARVMLPAFAALGWPPERCQRSASKIARNAATESSSAIVDQNIVVLLSTAQSPGRP